METKICPKCEEEKSIDCFSKNKSRKSGYSSECKSCHKVTRKEYYEANKAKEVERVRLRREQQIKTIQDMKSNLGCKLCGENHIATLHFHHLDPNEKEIGIAMALRLGWGLDRLKAEIDKCVVLCANCHAKEHHELSTTGKSLLQN